MPSVHEAAKYLPIGSNETCLTGFCCSRRKTIFSVSCTLTTLTKSSLCTSVAARIVNELDLLACYSTPVSVWRQSDISNRQCTSDEHLVQFAARNLIPGDGAIFSCANPKVILGYHQRFVLCFAIQGYGHQRSVPRSLPVRY